MTSPRAHHRRQGALLRAQAARGTRLVVIEAARNLACVGAVPKALVNCLN